MRSRSTVFTIYQITDIIRRYHTKELWVGKALEKAKPENLKKISDETE